MQKVTKFLGLGLDPINNFGTKSYVILGEREEGVWNVLVSGVIANFVFFFV